MAPGDGGADLPDPVDVPGGEGHRPALGPDRDEPGHLGPGTAEQPGDVDDQRGYAAHDADAGHEGGGAGERMSDQRSHGLDDLVEAQGAQQRPGSEHERAVADGGIGRRHDLSEMPHSLRLAVMSAALVRMFQSDAPRARPTVRRAGLATT